MPDNDTNKTMIERWRASAATTEEADADELQFRRILSQHDEAQDQMEKEGLKNPKPYTRGNVDALGSILGMEIALFERILKRELMHEVHKLGLRVKDLEGKVQSKSALRRERTNALIGPAKTPARKSAAKRS